MFPIYFEINFHDPGQPLAARVVRRIPRTKRKDVNNNERNGGLARDASPKGIGKNEDEEDKRQIKNPTQAIIRFNNLLAQRAESAKAGQPVASAYNRPTMVIGQSNRPEQSGTGRTTNGKYHLLSYCASF
uniref:Uncharacterized protein n=1 Tax=Anopheles culicifacies TaxID=139723 RepID=A0A182LSQ5_9DIPT